MTSEDFSLSLLNPASLDYKENERKFTNILEKTFRKSHLRDAFVRIIIDGFSSGSIKVFFKVILDKAKIPEKLQANCYKNIFIKNGMINSENHVFIVHINV